MRTVAGATLAGLLALPFPALAQEWELEVTAGGGLGSRFTRNAPFEFRGLSFAGPYRTCTGPENLCRFFGVTDVEYALEYDHTLSGFGGVEGRRRVGESLLLGGGLLGGLAVQTQRLVRGSRDEIIAGRPLEPDNLREASGEIDNVRGRRNGVGLLSYLHVGLRHDRGFERRTPIGYKPSSFRIFVEAGGGLLASLPGGGDAGLGHPPALHLGGGVRFRRGPNRALTLSVLHVRALANTDDLLESRLDWTALRVGWVFER